MVAVPRTDGYVIRSTRRLADGSVEVKAIPADLRPLVVVVPYARSSAADIDQTIKAALSKRRPKKGAEP